MIARVLRKGSERRRLRHLLALFFVALALPTGVLIQQAYSQLKWEAFHQQRQNAEQVARQIDRRLSELIQIEESRSFADYTFLVISGDANSNFLQPSRLSDFPISAGIPGLLGYFQVDARGMFSSPLLPAQHEQAANYGITAEQYRERLALENQIRNVLSENRLVRSQPGRLDASAVTLSENMAEEAPAISADQDIAARAEIAEVRSPAIADETLLDREFSEQEADDRGAQVGFDELKKSDARRQRAAAEPAQATLGKVADLQLDQKLETQSRNLELAQQSPPLEGEGSGEKRGKRREQGYVPETPAAAMPEPLASGAATAAKLRIDTFDSEIDPFEFSLLDSGQFVLYRKVWRDGQRYIQGALIEQLPFLTGTIETPFLGSAQAISSSLIVAYRGDVLGAFQGVSERDYLSSSRELSGSLLYQTRLSSPLSELELLFSITRLPTAPGGQLIGWIAVVLVLVLCGGFILMYRLGLRQIQLARQQQDFVAAVSHELKTPLTSIRMYGEMLRAGWADEAKKQSYYDFIFDESERLSRLISNVLQLASLSHNEPQMDLKPVTVNALLDLIESKVASQVERSGFRLELDIAEAVGEKELKLDIDCFAQVLINLVDNAIKFSAKADQKVIRIGVQPQSADEVLFTVRDFGPGVAKSQMKKIFLLFYRSEGELTRETVGTGIGLALVHRLTLAMGGKVDVRNREPGAEFRLSFSSI